LTVTIVRIYDGYDRDMMVTSQAGFGSHADRVVHLGVAIVNALTPGDERGRPVPSLTPAANEARARESGLRGHDDIALLTRLAADLRPVFEATSRGSQDGAVELVNQLIDKYQPVPYLGRDAGESWRLHYMSTSLRGESSWGAGCVAALASVLGSSEWRRLGVCSAERCDRVFVDISRNGTRRYCSAA
jgi:predicted RNA-binding Zn ribbon-like protein